MTTKRNYTEAEKLAYWREKALAGSSRASNGGGYGYKNTNRKPKSKRSGAKLTRYVNSDGVEMFLTTGWRIVKGSLIAIKATTTKKSVESDKGWFGSVAVTFTNQQTGEQNFHWGTMEKKSGKVVVDAMAFVMNPRAKNGGYSGTYINKG